MYDLLCFIYTCIHGEICVSELVLLMQLRMREKYLISLLTWLMLFGQFCNLSCIVL